MRRFQTCLLTVAVLAACGDSPTDPADGGHDVGTDVVGDASDAGDDTGSSEPDADATGSDAAHLDTSDATVPPDVDGDSDASAVDADPDAETSGDVSDTSDAADVEVEPPWVSPEGDLPPDFVPTDDEFIVVVLPDTQIYALRFPETFESQLRWIAERAEEYRIVFVSHVGDIVQNGDAQDQWDVARAAYDWIDDIDLPHGFSVAGHDVSQSGRVPDRPWDSSCSVFANTDCNAVDYLAHFGPDSYEGRDWFGGASPSGQSNYQRVEVEGMSLLFVHVPQDAPAAEVAWAKEVLDANPGTLAHLTTHRYLFDYRLTDALPPPLNILPAGRFNTMTYTLGGQSQMYNTALTADELFEELVAAHPNVWAVHCGHVDAEYRQTSTNSAGLPVFEILADYQDMADGGGGWLRLLRFSPSANRVEALTFSTVTGAVRRNGDGFDHAIDILEAYEHEARSFLEAFGLTEERTRALLDSVRDDTPERRAYYESLYGAGARDSRFVMEVDFAAYIDASR